MWVLLTLCSAFCLGIYDVLRKYVLRYNAVLPILLCSTFTSSIFMAVILILSKAGIIPMDSYYFVPSIPLYMHTMLVVKAAIVLSSWICVYYALKNLPLSIVSPIRSTAPMWTLIGALIIYSERLNLWQWSGFFVVMAAFMLFAIEGKKEGIRFAANIWVWLVLLGTLIGSASALFDKYLVRELNIPRMAILTYYSFYEVILLIPLLLIIWFPHRKENPWVWMWAAPFIGIVIVLADFFYYGAIQCPDSLISLISPIRRSNVLVSFTFAAFLFKEKNILRKSICLAGILLGVTLIAVGS